jgi:hypothetical protein
MTTEGEKQDEGGGMGNDAFHEASDQRRQVKNAVERPSESLDKRERDAAARASSSTEDPTNVARSTEDLTVGGNKKQPQDADRWEDTPEPRSPAEQALENQQRALESGQESPG